MIDIADLCWHWQARAAAFPPSVASQRGESVEELRHARVFGQYFSNVFLAMGKNTSAGSRLMARNNAQFRPFFLRMFFPVFHLSSRFSTFIFCQITLFDTVHPPLTEARLWRSRSSWGEKEKDSKSKCLGWPILLTDQNRNIINMPLSVLFEVPAAVWLGWQFVWVDLGHFALLAKYGMTFTSAQLLYTLPSLDSFPHRL